MNKRVYQPACRQGKLYGLTEKEIKIVEEKREPHPNPSH
jgi:hypothetical protein